MIRTLCDEWPAVRWAPAAATGYDITVTAEGRSATARWVGALPGVRDGIVIVARHERGDWCAVHLRRGHALGCSARTMREAVRRLRYALVVEARRQ